MTWLALRLLVGGGRARSLMILAGTAVVTALLLVALTLIVLPPATDEVLFEVVADPGTRGGVVLAAVLLVVPPLLLLHQALRFGTAAREQRLAGLRLAGATPADVRRLSALEVGLPAVAGAALGVPLFEVLRLVVGGDPEGWTSATAASGGCTDGGAFSCSAYSTGSVGQLIPRSVTPDLWMVVLVVGIVGALGAVVGARTGSRLTLSPHGVTRRRPARPPRPWGLLGLVVTPLLFPVVDSTFDTGDDLVALVLVALPVLSIASLGPWIAHLAGRRALTMASRPATLLAAGRLVADPRPAGRAAAAVGGIGLVAGGGAGLLADLLTTGPADAYYLVPLILVAVCLLAGLIVVSSTLVVHAVESLGDRRRSVAAQLAQGVPVDELERSLRWEGGLVAVPLGVAGAVLGVAAFTGVNEWGLYETTLGAVATSGLLVAVGTCAVVAGLTLVAVGVSARLVRPAVRAAARPDHLRNA